MNVLNHKWTQLNANKKRGTGFQPVYMLTVILLYSSASAQTVMELFNPAAREYIVGNNAGASNLVTQALQQYPTDEKLQKLKELIDQQNQDQKNQDQKNQDQKNQDQKNQDQQNQDQQNQDQQNQDQQNQDQQNQDQQNQDQQNQDQQNQDQQPEKQEPQEAQPSQAQSHQAGEMSEEEAQQLLDSMKQNEKDLRSDLRPFLGRPVKVDKDW